MKTRLLAIVALMTAGAGAMAATCKGEDPCKACKNCSQCRYCTSGKGSCSVAREEADRAYEQRKRKNAQEGRKAGKD